MLLCCALSGWLYIVLAAGIYSYDIILGEVRSTGCFSFRLQDLTVTAVQSLTLICGNNYIEGGNVQKLNEKECLR